MLNNVERKRNCDSSIEQKFNLRIQLYQVNKFIKEENEDRNNTMNVTGIENLSLNYHPTKELGRYYGNINYYVYKDVQEILDEYRKKKLVDDFNINPGLFQQKLYKESEYKECLEKLAQIAGKRLLLKYDASNYADLCCYYTIKEIGSGDFGSGYLTVKAKKAKFKHEMDVVLEKYSDLKDNLYIMKNLHFPDDNHKARAAFLALLRKSLNTEILIGRSLYHPNVCEFYGAYASNHFCLLVQEYLCCGNIATIIDDDFIFYEHRDLYKKRILFYVSQILMAIEYLHKNSIYHTDIKDANVILDYRGYAKIIDFGVAITDNQLRIDNAMIPCVVNFRCKLEYRNQYEEHLTEYTQYYFNHLNRGNLYELDMFSLIFFLSKFLGEYLNKLYDNDNDDDEYIDITPNEEMYIISACSGADVGDAIRTDKTVPRAEQLRRYDYFKSINFTKLLFREYDLETELKLNLEGLFLKYSKSSKKNLIFEDDNRQTFKRKNQIDFLKSKYKDLYNVFI